MDNLERRVIALEHQRIALQQDLGHEREMTDWRFADLSRRLQALEQAATLSWSRIPLGSVMKLVVAFLLPLTVWFATGDLRKALQAAHLAGLGG